MSKISSSKANKLKYSNLSVTYEIKKKQVPDTETLQELQEALSLVGVMLYTDDNSVTIKLNPDKYSSVKDRAAGRRRKMTLKKASEKYEPYRYSDIILMMNTMSDKDIMETIKMTEPTFYRHKRTMVNSDYYKNLDNAKIGNADYLKSLVGNNVF